MRTANKLRISKQAQTQLVEIIRYTRLTFGPVQARKLSADMKDLFRQIAAFPLSRPIDPESAPLRRAVLHPFVVLYAIDQNSVSIVSLLHGARDRNPPLPS